MVDNGIDFQYTEWSLFKVANSDNQWIKDKNCETQGFASKC